MPESDATEGFSPIAGGRARILILGTLPSRQSIRLQQYYGNPRNAFWPIMKVLFSAGPEMSYCDRVRLLTRNEVAVWDVLAAGDRPGSMDAAIVEERAEPNDFAKFVTEHPELHTICFNGQTAAKLFRRLVATDVQDVLAAVRFITLPSTSPAYAAMSFEHKLEHWANALAGRRKIRNNEV